MFGQIKSWNNERRLKMLLLTFGERKYCGSGGAIKGRVHCFSMQVVMNKYFLLNPEKKLAQICLVAFEKNAPLIPKMTSPSRRLEI